jgi:hypothetical protein
MRVGISGPRAGLGDIKKLHTGWTYHVQPKTAIKKQRQKNAKKTPQRRRRKKTGGY